VAIKKQQSGWAGASKEEKGRVAKRTRRMHVGVLSATRKNDGKKISSFLNWEQKKGVKKGRERLRWITIGVRLMKIGWQNVG